MLTLEERALSRSCVIPRAQPLSSGIPNGENIGHNGHKYAITFWSSLLSYESLLWLNTSISVIKTIGGLLLGS